MLKHMVGVLDHLCPHRGCLRQRRWGWWGRRARWSRVGYCSCYGYRSGHPPRVSVCRCCGCCCCAAGGRVGVHGAHLGHPGAIEHITRTNEVTKTTLHIRLNAPPGMVSESLQYWQQLRTLREHSDNTFTCWWDSPQWSHPFLGCL